jgi:hypothetical protein
MGPAPISGHAKAISVAGAMAVVRATPPFIVGSRSGADAGTE